MSVFPRFDNLPLELRRRTWFFALPGPRIIYVQRRFTSRQYAEEEFNANVEFILSAPNNFMSPSSSNQIITLLQTCKESYSVVKENYTLLFPASSTWFSFSADFLYLGFGLDSHTLPYETRDLAFSRDMLPPSRRYPQPAFYPKFDPELAKRVENLVISKPTVTGRMDELVVVFTKVKVLVLADQLFSTCHEYNEELVWLRGKLGDEMSSTAQLNVDKLWHESEIDKGYRQLLTNLPLWKGPMGYVELDVLEDKAMNELLQNWLTIGERPIVIQRSMVTIKTKDILIDICGSEDNFQVLTDLNWEYVQWKQKYSGSLDQYQQLSFLELMLARFSADLDCRCMKDCIFKDEVEEDIRLLLDRIDMLVLEM